MNISALESTVINQSENVGREALHGTLHLLEALRKLINLEYVASIEPNCLNGLILELKSKDSEVLIEINDAFDATLVYKNLLRNHSYTVDLILGKSETGEDSV